MARHKGFGVHMLNNEGKLRAHAISETFDQCLERLRALVPEGRELSLVITKLEEACGFAKRGMAGDPQNIAEPPKAEPIDVGEISATVEQKKEN